MLNEQLIKYYKDVCGADIVESILKTHSWLFETDNTAKQTVTPQKIQSDMKKLMSNPEIVEKIENSIEHHRMQDVMHPILPKLEALFGLNTLVAGPDKQLSEAFGKIIPETDVQVRVYPTILPNAFTFPFVNLTRSRMFEVSTHLPYLQLFTTASMFLATLSNTIFHRRFGEPTVSDGKLLLPGVDKTTIYISSKMLDILEPKEIVAVGLHELVTILRDLALCSCRSCR